jgi:hypothetical protein
MCLHTQIDCLVMINLSIIIIGTRWEGKVIHVNTSLEMMTCCDLLVHMIIGHIVHHLLVQMWHPIRNPQNCGIEDRSWTPWQRYVLDYVCHIGYPHTHSKVHNLLRPPCEVCSVAKHILAPHLTFVQWHTQHVGVAILAKQSNALRDIQRIITSLETLLCTSVQSTYLIKFKYPVQIFESRHIYFWKLDNSHGGLGK